MNRDPIIRPTINEILNDEYFLENDKYDMSKIKNNILKAHEEKEKLIFL